jgi:predicted KAP-like P-loop ATPase
VEKNDHPISRKDDDLLGRDSFARIIADEIQSLDVSHGSVVAVTGPWGSGKTSLMNLVKDHLGSKITQINFNPWFFSGSDDLLERFFSEFATAMNPKKKRQKAVANALTQYGQALRPLRGVPVASAYADLASSTLEGAGKVLSTAKGSPIEIKERLEEALREQDRIFLVFIDNIDRLESDEIGTIMKLVRLVGSLPKVIYLLAYDHSRVVQALSEGNQQGEEYLEKIVFNAYQIPQIHKSFIQDALISGLNEILSEFSIQVADDPARVSEVIHHVLLPSMKTLRNVKRFLASCRPVCKELHHDVDFLDLVCLECLRLFSPQAFVELSGNSHGIAWTVNDSQIFNTPRFTLSKEAVAAVLERDPGSWVRWILKNLFPFSWRHYDERFSPESDPNKFLRDRRVGNRDVFQILGAI